MDPKMRTRPFCNKMTIFGSKLTNDAACIPAIVHGTHTATL